MTEQEWLASKELMPMLVYLRGEVEQDVVGPDQRFRFAGCWSGEGTRVSKPQLARFASECCAKWWELPLDEWYQRLIVLYEQFLQDHISWTDFLSHYHQLQDAIQRPEPLLNTIVATLWTLTPVGVGFLERDLSLAICRHGHRNRIQELTCGALEDDDSFGWGFFGYDIPEYRATTAAFRGVFPGLLRETVGNPFRPVALDPAWLAPTVTRIAEAIYAERALERLPILADALEDIGCTNAEILNHCRLPDGHVRGCWALDLLRGKSLR